MSHAARCPVLLQCLSVGESRRWDAIIAVCLSSAFHTTKAALPGMLDAGWGRIINTGSMHALVASPYKSAYNAAKHGIAGAWQGKAYDLQYHADKFLIRALQRQGVACSATTS